MPCLSSPHVARRSWHYEEQVTRWGPRLTAAGAATRRYKPERVEVMGLHTDTQIHVHTILFLIHTHTHTHTHRHTHTHTHTLPSNSEPAEQNLSKHDPKSTRIHGSLIWPADVPDLSVISFVIHHEFQF